MTKATKTRKRAKRPPLTTQQAEHLETLGKLGPAITPADCAKILNVPEKRLAAYLASPEGAKLWQTARATGRAELATVIRSLALEGHPQAQRILASSLAGDDSAGPMQSRVLARDVHETMDRTAARIRHRVRTGEMIAAGHDGRYLVADLVRLIPTLWDRLAAARDALARLEAKTTQAETDKAEAQRLLALEQLRARRRENDIAEGRLVEADKVRRQIELLAQTIRAQTSSLAREITLKLSLPDHAAATVEKAKREYLERIARIMEGAANG